MASRIKMWTAVMALAIGLQILAEMLARSIVPGTATFWGFMAGAVFGVCVAHAREWFEAK